LPSFNTSLVRNMSAMFIHVFVEVINVTNFNTSLVEDMALMFAKNGEEMSPYINGEKPVEKQEIVGLTNFDTSRVYTMNYMFAGSVGLSSLDLSNFNTSLVKNMGTMFYECISLKYLDISNFNLTGKSFFMTFSDVKLKYINIYNVIYTSSNNENDFLGENSHLNDSINDGLMVCQKEKIIEGDKVTYGCCLFDIESLNCANYLKAKYGKKIEYKNGFIKNNKQEQNNYRTNIDYILNGQNKVSIEESFTIAADSEIRIYFNKNQTNIEHFFDSEYDPNVESITQIDVSYLISENLTLF